MHVITNFSGKGGAERMLERLIKETPSVSHHLVSLIQVSDLYRDALRLSESYCALGWSLKSTPAVVFQLARKMKVIQPDVIQCWMYHANALGALSAVLAGKHKRLIWGVRHSLDSYADESISTKVALRTGNVLARIPSASIYCSRAALEQHQRFGYSTKSDVYIPNGVDLELFRSQRAPRKERGDDFTVGVVARFHEAKGFEYLLKSVSLVHMNRKDVIFMLAGRGVSLDNPAFMKLIAQNHVDINRVVLCGDVDDMPAFYRRLDVLVQSSITEGFPNVLVEAMASGVPCIATDVGDSREIVGDTGFIVPSREPVAMADAILSYVDFGIEQKVAYEERASLRASSCYDISVVAGMYMNAWRGVHASQSLHVPDDE